MSKSRTETITCPSCQATQDATVWSIINSGNNPELREELFNGGINVLTCRTCGHAGFYSVPLMYHDPARRFCVWYHPLQGIEHDAFLDLFTDEGRFKMEFAPSRDQLPGAHNYFEDAHVVFDLNELIRYVLFREALFERAAARNQ